jgi:hypothetical protein
MRRILVVVGAALIAAMAPRTAVAQIGPIEKAIERFEFFNIALQQGKLVARPRELSAAPPGKEPNSGWLSGVAVEFAFKLADTTKAFGVPVTLDLGVSYGQLAGLTATDPTLAFAGALRELPAVTVYANFLTGAVSPYVGLRTGLASFHQASFFDLDPNGGKQTQYAIAAQTLQYGPVVGVIAPIRSVEFFVESTYLHRRFAGLQYTAKDNVVPTKLPRSLDVSGATVSVGIQVRVK